MQKKRIGYIILFILSVGIIVIVSFVGLKDKSRENYGVIDFEKDLWIENFVTSYQTAITQGDDWIKDAKTVALKVAGYPNEDQIPPEKVDMETTLEGRVIVTILSPVAMDDSILRQETRVELIKDKEIWKIDWAGIKQQCRRGSFGMDWTTLPCP